jgi:hypothetical protein
MTDPTNNRTDLEALAVRPDVELLALSAYLPFHTVAFTFPNEGIPFLCGVYRLEFVRPSTESDEKRFRSPPDDCCPMCGSKERW